MIAAAVGGGVALLFMIVRELGEIKKILQRIAERSVK
jgi:hypothetical protein